MTKDNNVLGSFELNSIPPALKGVPKVEVTFDLDADGILNVSALGTGSNAENNIIIKSDKGRLTQSEIGRMLAEAERYREYDHNYREKSIARNNFECFLSKLRDIIIKSGDNLSSVDEKLAFDICEGMHKWLEDNKRAEMEEIGHKVKEATEICSRIIFVW